MHDQKKPKGTAREGFGILNPYGDMWTTEIFATEAEAREYVKRFWSGVRRAKPFDYRIVRARQRTTFVRALGASDAG